jgi:predicted transcriptional regulator
MELTEWAKLQEELLKAQLGVVRGYLRSKEPDGRERKVSQRKSQMSIITDILSSAGTSLHVSEIMRRAGERYGVDLDRESIVSALTKKVKKGALFVRTGPNTFGLKGR